MDAYPPQAEIDALGRRGGPRRRLPLEEKRRIAEETLQPGASVALVARWHDLNANVVFAWRRKYREGGLGEASHTPGLIPIKLLPSDATGVVQKRAPIASSAATVVELKRADGTQLRISGELAHEALREIIAAVLAR